MKVYFVARGWPSEEEPQWGCFERDQALALAALGHKIIVLSVDVRVKFHFRKYGITKQKEGRISIYNLYAGPFWGRPIKYISLTLFEKVNRVLFLYLIKRVMKIEGQPDLLYAHYLGNSEMALSAKWKYNIPIIGIEHFSSLGKKEIWDQILERAKRTYKHLDTLLTVSNSLRDNIRKQLNVDSIVVHNMVGKEFYYQDVKREDGIVRFIAVGNLLPVKGYDILIDAFNEVHLSGKWMLDIIGGGAEYNKLAERVKDYGLGERIHLHGRKDRQTVIRYLHKSDVYVLSSRLETFGVAALEALACGIPVIATECGGPTEFINETNGVTCPVEDVGQLAQSIQYMYDHYKDFNKKQIAVDCQKRFSSEAIGKQLEGIFEEVIRKSKQK